MVTLADSAQQAETVWNVLTFLIGSGILGGVITLTWYARGFAAALSDMTRVVETNHAAVSEDIRDLRDITRDMIAIKNDHVTDIALLKERWQDVHRRLKTIEHGVQGT